MVLGKLEIHNKRMKLDPCFTSHAKINKKWGTDLNVRAKTVKLSEESIGVYLCHPDLSNDFLDIKLKA